MFLILYQSLQIFIKQKIMLIKIKILEQIFDLIIYNIETKAKFFKTFTIYFKYKFEDIN